MKWCPACALRKVWQCCSTSDIFFFRRRTNENSFGLQCKDKRLTFAPMSHSYIVIAVYYKMLLIFRSSYSFFACFTLKFTNFQIFCPSNSYDRPLCRDINTLTTVLRYLSPASSKTKGTSPIQNSLLYNQ